MSEPRQLADWVELHLPPEVSVPRPLELRPLPGDAGFRRYFRLVGSPSLIATHAPPAHEDSQAFVAKGLALAGAGVRVPRIYAVDYRCGFLLQEDLGSDLMADALRRGAAPACYRRALETLASIQRVPPDPGCFPAYDAALLEGELALFPQWFIGELLGIALCDEERRLLGGTWATLVESARQQPQVVVHRDFHSRNLLLTGSRGLGVVDFQDAVIGPVTYDLVSLLRDCYHRLDEADLDRYLTGYLDAAGVPAAARPQWRVWFDLMGLQRHLKVLGIFARLWLRDGKARYLDDLPLVIRYVLEVARHHAATREFAAWFQRRLLPAAGGQPWYRDWRTAGIPCAR
ncbi:MAG: aminoglycoside phosphotransferase family protein [Pseudomonadota bacterium]